VKKPRVRGRKLLAWLVAVAAATILAKHGVPVPAGVLEDAISTSGAINQI